MSERRLCDRLVETIVRRRGVVVLAWAVACLTLLPAAHQIESRLRVAARVEGSESAAVDEQLTQRFQSPFAHSVVLVASGIPSPLDVRGADVLRALTDSLRNTPGVTRVFSYLDGREPLFAGAARDGSTGTFVIVGLDEQSAPDLLLDSLRRATARFAAVLRRDYPTAALRWTGEVALNTDLRRVSAAGARRAEARALPLTFALLLVAFGAVAAALLPVAGALLSIGVTLGIAALVAVHWSLSILLQNVVSMIGLGLGIDYALLIVQRFRGTAVEYRSLAIGEHGSNPSSSPGSDALTADARAREALRTAGPTILLSGTAVAIGFGALAIVPVNELRSVAVGGLIVTVVSMLVATTLLPGVLASLGRRVDFGRVPLVRRRVDVDWSRWATFVTRHPGRVLFVAGLPIALLAWQARRISTVLPRSDWLPKQVESAIALHTLEVMGRSAVVQTVRLTVELPPGTSAVDDSGWAATARLARRLVADSAVERVRSLPGLLAPLAGTLPRDLLLAELPDAVRRSFVSRDGRLAMLEVIPREGTSPAAIAALVRRIRVAAPPVVTPAGSARIQVGGLPALNIDYEEAVAGPRRFTQVVALVVIATFLVLAIGFRSVLVPLKAIVLNLVAVAGAFGAVTLVFQDGYGALLLGLSAPLGGIFPAIPVLVFCVVFGLSMDYEVFLVARVREARMSGLGERAAIADGLAHTGRLITSAAAIMIVVFGAFMAGDFLLMKMLGFALAVSVLIDATVMRLAVSPALLTLAGRWNWWPGASRAAPSTTGVAARGGDAYSQPMQSPATAGPSRREFLGKSALGLLAITRFSRFAHVPNAQELLYVGSYTDATHAEGVALVHFDARSAGLQLLHAVDAGPNPSFLAIHPSGRVLYAVNEVAERAGQSGGGVSAFSLGSDGTLARVGDQSSQGAGPCYVSVDRSGRAVLVANYDGGSVALLPITSNGGLAPATSVDQHHGHGPNAERQEAAHAHCIVADPSNRFALAADLGLDRVMLYGLDAAAGSLQRLERGDANLVAGAGPRHIAFHPKRPLVYVVGELDSTVTTLRFDAGAGRLTTVDSRSSLPAGWSGTSFAADIHVAPSGDTLYVSNRGHDSIAVFSIAASSGTLTLEQTISTGGAWPRNFTLDRTGHWLLVANQNSDSIVVLARDPRSGQLSPTSQRLAIAKPVCVRFRAHAGVTT